MTTPLERLIQLAPPVDRPGRVDWSEAERRLGHELPTDYKELVDAYGPGEFDRHVRLRAPKEGGGARDLIRMNDGYFEELEDLWENDEAPPEIEDEEDTILVVWARTKDAETLNWVVRPGTEPDTWPVMVLNDDADVWETYPVTATVFLAGLLAGDIDSILSSELTPPDHTFEPDPM